MKSYLVKDLMVPLSEYATVTENARLFEAVLALEKAQENFEDEHTRYRHRAVLVLDKKGKVIGKQTWFHTKPSSLIPCNQSSLVLSNDTPKISNPLS